LELGWPHLEWIVVDNASSDGSVEMVRKEFGERVRLVERNINSVTAGRNDGFREAGGDYILSLDNDIVLADRGVIRKALDLFNRFPEAGLLAFKVASPESPNEHQEEHWWHPVSRTGHEDRFFFTTYYPEGAAFFHAEALRLSGGYDESFFMGAEQFDLTLALLREGYRVLYCPNLIAQEEDVRGNLAARKNPIHYFNIRNKLWAVWKHFPVMRGLRYSVGRLAAGGWRALRYGYFGTFLAGVREGLFAPKEVRQKRRPLPPEAWLEYDRMQRGWFVEPESTGDEKVPSSNAGLSP
jgi:GT2 family glycosyltransferase